MSLNARLERLELAAKRNDPARPQSFPEAWLDRGEDGKPVGPGPDDDPTPGQLLLFEQVKAMDATISEPAQEACHASEQ
jgi:hypothetical protein